MATAPHRELDAFRDEADRFIAELDEEYYLHFAGHKDALDLEPIYERHAGLTSSSLPRLEAASSGAATPSCGASPARASSAT